MGVKGGEFGECEGHILEAEFVIANSIGIDPVCELLLLGEDPHVEEEARKDVVYSEHLCDALEDRQVQDELHVPLC